MERWETVPKKPEMDQALELLTYGAYVVTAAKDGREAAFLTPWLSQVSLDPPALALSVAAGTPAYELLMAGAPFVVNILRAGQKTLAESFREDEVGGDPLRGAARGEAANGCPYLTEALAIIECTPQSSVNSLRGYTLIIGEAASARILAEGQPLTLRQTGLPPSG